jgi:hypothetical protein
VDAKAAATGKPIYVGAKPKNLLRQYDPGSLLEIAGRGYVPDGRGGRRYITWRKS